MIKSNNTYNIFVNNVTNTETNLHFNSHTVEIKMYDNILSCFIRDFGKIFNKYS